MSGARHMTALALVLGLGFGTPVTAAAQNASSSWQSTPASILKSTLRNIVAAQDRYRASHPSFASSLEALQVKPGADVKIQLLGVSANGWRAKASHRTRPGRNCVVFVGPLGISELPKTEADGEMAGEERVPLCDRME